MSSALNRVRGLSRVSSLRAAHLLGHSWRKDYHRSNNLVARESSYSFQRNTHRASKHSYGTEAPLSCSEHITTNIHPRVNNNKDSKDRTGPPPSQPTSQSTLQNTTTFKPQLEDCQPTKTLDDFKSRTNERRRSLKQIPTPSEYLSKTLQKHVFEQEGHSSLRTFHYGTRKTYGRPRQMISLQATLAEYIRLVDPLVSGAPSHATLSEVRNDLDIALAHVFRPENREYLAARGYDIEDVVSWAWIMKSQNARRAIARMFALQGDGTSRQLEIPVFIPLFLLKEHHLDAQSFRLLLVHALHLMSGHPPPSVDSLYAASGDIEEPASSKYHPRITLGTCVTLVSRLVRHARQVWPRALPTIATIFSRFLTRSHTKKTEESNMSMQKLNRGSTEKFNTCLWLLSMPTKVNPFRAASIQQQAQFEILKSMASHKPVLPLSRKGYQAIVAVQLAHKKTLAERQSAELKSPSWPPWKEEKLGMDAQRGNEGLQSRAMNVLSQMTEAGYSHRVWEKTSSILAGWDTDRSPTIQTRTLVPRSSSLSRASDDEIDNYAAIWAARIRATRTIREAWACFLAYQDKGLPPKLTVYAEMCAKLIYRQMAIKGRVDEIGQALPGDGPEVHAEPASARDIIYVHTEPPTVEDLVQEMFSHGFRPSGRFLALLLRSAPTFRTGLGYLRRSDLSEKQIAALCVIWGHPSQCPAPYLKTLGSLPDTVFVSFIKLLCTRSKSIRMKMAGRYALSPNDFPALTENTQTREPLAALSDFSEELGQWRHPRALWHAVQLVKLRQPYCHSAWVHILDTMSTERVNKKHTDRTRCLYRIIGWHETLAVLRLMKARDVHPGSQGFKALCIAFKKAVDAGIRHPGLVEEALGLVNKATQSDQYLSSDLDAFNDMVEAGLKVLKDEFECLVLPSSAMPDLVEHSVFVAEQTDQFQLKVPLGLHVPSFVTLHSFVGALGIAGDDDGLLHLLHWMSRSFSELSEASQERQNGTKNMRLTLVATRTYLEQLQSKSKLREGYDIFHKTGWEWPTDEEVEEYSQGLYK
ncbi:hypothetical protein N7533_006738 [Penicillium manginii]|uniref:uncharacterized protein n=1 Tax=Penicillium manginii TaxID=203109 RepID=UPI00254818F2|nr:uncharacterized protein N7533_006738 [Penicillium manginii]KAJ5749710.1 hypothetical protein N7533_006738 [Penicillium manginii]